MFLDASKFPLINLCPPFFHKFELNLNTVLVFNGFQEVSNERDNTLDKDIKPGTRGPSLELFRSRETRRRVSDTCYEKVHGRGAFKTLQRFLDRNCGMTFKLRYSGKIVVYSSAWLHTELACNLIARNLRRIPHSSSSLAERPRESRHFTFNDKLNSRVLPIDRSINSYTRFY